MKLFCYGTLMVPAVWRAVVGRERPHEPACLKGYSCRRLRGACYPGLALSSGGRTPGLVYRGLNAADLQRLDRYEGAGYRRTRLAVASADGTLLPAWVYVLAPPVQRRLTGERWALERFVADDLQDYLRTLGRH